MKMMSHLLKRQFVNIVSENCKTAISSLHRLIVSEHLFYPSTAEAEAAKPAAAAATEAEAAKPAAAISRLESLPKPISSFQPEPRLRNLFQFFALVNPRSSESRILWSSPEGVTIVHDVDSNCSRAIPSLRYKGFQPIAISVPCPDAPPEEEDLYVLSSNSSYPGFEVFTFGGDRTYKSPFRRSYAEKPWQWESLPPLPLPMDFSISSHTVLDDGITICVTATSTGGDVVGDDEEEYTLTYLFDTVKRAWRQVNGRRLDLPFLGRAEYIPDLKLWLGLCRDEHRLCTYDLLSAAAGKPQTLKHLGEEVEMPKEWDSVKASLINLGGGRFCIVKLIQEEWGGEEADSPAGTVSTLTLLTGVEMVRGEEGFKMVTHKSLSYIFGNDRIQWVL